MLVGVTYEEEQQSIGSVQCLKRMGKAGNPRASRYIVAFSNRG